MLVFQEVMTPGMQQYHKHQDVPVVERKEQKKVKD